MAAVDLRFGAAPIAGPPYNLVFGAVDGAVASEDFSLSLRATLPGLTLRASLTALDGLALQAALPGLALRASLTALDGVTLQATALLPGLRLSGKLIYDNRVTRYLHRPALAPQQVAVPAGQAVGGAWRTSRSEQCGVAPSWRLALPVRHTVDVSHRVALARALTVMPGWQVAQALALQAASLAQVADQLAQARQSAWQTAQALGIRAAGRFEVADRLLHTAAALHQVASQRGYVAAGKMGRANHISTALLMPWQLARWPAVGKGVWPPVVVTPAGHVGSTHLLFQCPPLRELPLQLVFSAYPCGRAPLPPARIVIPILRTYVTINSISLHRVDTGAELHAHGFSMSLDADSWTWSWSASLHYDAANHLGRDAEGDPAELAVAINGIPFRLRLGQIQRDRRFSPTRWAVSGKGKAAILGAPYAPRMSFGNTQPRTAQQLMADVLTVNGVSLGWTVDWGLTDWLVPDGAWSLQGSYIEAINDIAVAAGGYVQPHATDAVLRVLPRYPAAPWAWNNITPDFEIPADAAEVEATEYVDKPAYNRVFVGGVGAGVFGPFTRAGSAGNVLAPQVTHALITHADAHRQRGLAELSDTGRQEHITLKMQVLPETGIITPGKFIRYLGDKTVMGIVRSTSIDWSFPKLRQTLKVETHE